MATMKIEHFVSASCSGETCGFSEGLKICNRPAIHKVGEEIPHDDPRPIRHNLTMYVCCLHFGQILGRAARERCGLEENKQ